MASVKNQLSVSPTLILAPTPTYIPTIIPSHTVSLTSCAYKPNGAICIVNNQAGVCSHHQCIPPNHPQPTSPPVDCDSPNSPKYCNY